MSNAKPPVATQVSSIITRVSQRKCEDKPASIKRPIKRGVVCSGVILEGCFAIRASQLVDFVRTPRFESHSLRQIVWVMTANGLRYCTVARSPNGRIKTNCVQIGGREEHHPEGSYYIDWYEGDKRQRRSVGKNALRAEAEYRELEQRFAARAASQKAGLKIIDDAGQIKLADAVTSYLAETQLTKKPKTLAAYTTALDYFLESCRKQYVAEIERRDLLEFRAFLRDGKEQSLRSCWNKFANIMSFLKAKWGSWSSKKE